MNIQKFMSEIITLIALSPGEGICCGLCQQCYSIDVRVKISKNAHCTNNPTIHETNAYPCDFRHLEQSTFAAHLGRAHTLRSVAISQVLSHISYQSPHHSCAFPYGNKNEICNSLCSACYVYMIPNSTPFHRLALTPNRFGALWRVPNKT